MAVSNSTARAGDEAAAAISAARGGRGAALKAVTANRLADGVVVYYAEGGEWAERIEHARVAEDKDAAASLLADAERDVGRCRVIAPYLIDVVRGDGGALRPTTYREKIRAAGPSIHPDLGKQAAES
jgi:hypothetical protein